jgi:hypothetical protein
VKIVESTQSRIHVRWTYEPVDNEYQVSGDQTVEDYYFYPDGFGTRVVTITAPPDAANETTEFIVVLPQSAFPLEVLPKRVVEMVYLDGAKREIRFPIEQPDGQQKLGVVFPHQEQRSAVYRIYQEKRDLVPAIHFAPKSPPPVVAFGALYDQGEQVTPAFWGDHWPLARGRQPDRYWIHEGIHAGPAHVALMTWVDRKPAPLATSESITLDTLGQVRTLQEQRWAWLIAKSDASDDELRAWAASFSSPPAIEVTGAKLDAPSYAQERRALRLVIESPAVEIRLKPKTHTMNPVFELDGATANLARVTLDGKAIPSDQYTWDGSTLWVKARIDSAGATLGLQFRSHPKSPRRSL